ncbi:MAG: glycosyltransferase family 4 protein [Cyanobacteria bacterium]|nr:glycosyltransferase family 4 protein [Cyanobacteriota bacterium]MDA0865079.1 glycosyltransferase family 4 protein [Cyanobacteriota bacterium]
MNISFYKREQQRLKVGVVANEFFDLKTGRMGGFGWATRQVANCFNHSPELGVDIVFVAGEGNGTPGQPDPIIHDTRVILRLKNKAQYVRKLWAEQFDLLLSIDYRPSYQSIFWTLPWTPIIVWVRDPRPPEDMAKIKTVRIPGAEHVFPQGLITPDCTSLAQVAKVSKWFRRPVLFGTPANFLKQKVPGTYGATPPEVKLLPNIIDMDPGKIVKSQKPSVVFLARLDPYKRPWLFVELARHFPEVDFIFLGQPHFTGEGAWDPVNLPENVQLKGHVQGTEKVRILSEAWVLVNTSIHEGLAVSFQESLRCETPLLSCVNPEEVVSNFGIYVGRHDGTGMQGIPEFIAGLRKLLDDHLLCDRLGKDGRKWVEKVHSKKHFLKVFKEFCAEINSA